MMYAHTTTDTGVHVRRVVLGRYTLHLDGARIGSVFGDHEIGFTATDKDGMGLGRHETLNDAAAVVHANLVNRVERPTLTDTAPGLPVATPVSA